MPPPPIREVLLYPPYFQILLPTLETTLEAPRPAHNRYKGPPVSARAQMDFPKFPNGFLSLVRLWFPRLNFPGPVISRTSIEMEVSDLQLRQRRDRFLPRPRFQTILGLSRSESGLKHLNVYRSCIINWGILGLVLIYLVSRGPLNNWCKPLYVRGGWADRCKYPIVYRGCPPCCPGVGVRPLSNM